MSYAAERKIIINTLDRLSPADRNTIIDFYTNIEKVETIPKAPIWEQKEYMHDLLDEHIALEKNGKGKIRSLLIWKLQKGMSL